ncbi:MAG: RNHCP domain-containing protein [Oligoflexus sp.]
MQMSKFTKLNDGFTCENCGQDIPRAEKTCRNHCPHCLHSKHVDINPGDRANPCQGLMRPIDYENHPKKGLMIRFRCLSCGFEGRNIAICDDAMAADDYSRILALTFDKYSKNLY